MDKTDFSEVERRAALNAVHIPTDAGEHAAGLAAILARIPDGWGRWIGCGRGWYPLLIETDQKLAALDPDYTVMQVKEKFGELAFYCALAHGSSAAGHAIVDEAARRSFSICELCGAPGSTREGGWIQTLCDEHADGRPASSE